MQRKNITILHLLVFLIKKIYMYIIIESCLEDNSLLTSVHDERAQTALSYFTRDLLLQI